MIFGAVALMLCKPVTRIFLIVTYQESPEAEPKTLVIAPYKLENSVEGWAVYDLPPEGFKGPRYPLKSIIAAELTDETFEDPYKDPAYVIAEMMAISR